MLLLACSLSLVVATGVSASSSADPGVTATTIELGGTVPLSGPASSYASVARGAEAYFKYVNHTRRGVHGRRISYKYLDDAYDPGRTVRGVRQLVQQDRVFAIFNTLGTEHNLAIRDYLNSVRVPHLFAGSGATTFSRDHRRYPWTIGYLPTYGAEGILYARHILRTKPTAKIAVLYQNDDYGKDLVRGLRKGLGAKRRAVVATQPYDATATDISSQIARLRSSKATVLVVVATPVFAIRAFVGADKLGWRPQIYVNQVASASNIMRIAETSASKRATRGAITLQSYKDPTSARWRNDPGMRFYRQIMRRYNPGGNANDVFHVYSMAVAYTTVNALRKAGKNLSRQSLMRAVTRLDERSNPFLLPGIRIKTSARDRYVVEHAQLHRWGAGGWKPVGGIVSARG